MFRLWRALWAKLWGMFGFAADRMAQDPHVMASTYDDAIATKGDRYKKVRGALARIITIQEERMAQIKVLNDQAERMTKVKNAAVGKAKELAAKSEGDIKSNPEYLKHMAAFNDASAKLNEATDQIKGREKEIEALKVQIAQYKVQLQQMERSQNDLRLEKEEALADVQIAKETKAVNDVMSGLTEDNIDKDLKSVRDARKNLRNEAKIAQELGGNSASLLEDEYLNYAESSQAASEFDALIGLGKQEAKDETEKELDPAKLPEEQV